ncbi:hypothetical protein Angca_009400, partial [Angiostrongylus cantonensis]
ESTVRTWFRKFRTGGFNFEDKEGRGRPSRLEDDEFKAIVEANTQKTVRKIPQQHDVCTKNHFHSLESYRRGKKLFKW